jgi:hypothetical protein
MMVGEQNQNSWATSDTGEVPTRTHGAWNGVVKRKVSL